MTDEQKRSWSKWYAEARADMKARHGRKRVRQSDYRAAWDAGTTVTAAVDAIATRTAEERQEEEPTSGDNS